MKLKSMSVAIIMLLVMLGGIGSTSILGLWSTTTDKVPVKYSDGQFSGQYNPADIRGSYTFGDISKSFDIPVEDLGDAFGVEDKNRYASFKCKELESLYSISETEGKEIGTGSVRYFVALYKGLPIDITEDVYLPVSAVNILTLKACLSQETLNYLSTHTVSMP